MSEKGESKKFRDLQTKHLVLPLDDRGLTADRRESRWVFMMEIINDEFTYRVADLVRDRLVSNYMSEQIIYEARCNQAQGFDSKKEVYGYLKAHYGSYNNFGFFAEDPKKALNYEYEFVRENREQFMASPLSCAVKLTDWEDHLADRGLVLPEIAAPGFDM